MAIYENRSCIPSEGAGGRGGDTIDRRALYRIQGDSKRLDSGEIVSGFYVHQRFCSTWSPVWWDTSKGTAGIRDMRYIQEQLNKLNTQEEKDEFLNRNALKIPRGIYRIRSFIGIDMGRNIPTGTESVELSINLTTVDSNGFQVWDHGRLIGSENVSHKVISGSSAYSLAEATNIISVEKDGLFLVSDFMVYVNPYAEAQVRIVYGHQPLTIERIADIPSDWVEAARTTSRQPPRITPAGMIRAKIESIINLGDEDKEA